MSNIIGRYYSERQIMNLFCNKHNMQRHAKNGKRWVCCECLSDAAYERKCRQKKKAVEYKGGCCIKCGYNKSLSALHFHHRIPKDKKFDLTKQNLSKSWNNIVEELDKCDLLCVNCHYSEHDRLDIEERKERKEAMKPKITMNRKEINRFNSKLLGIRSQP